MFPIGNQFTVKVNLTGSGLLHAFDVSLNYNITAGPNVLQAIGGSLTGGLFDPNSPPTGCSILIVKHEVDIPPGQIRFTAVVVGGCSVSGTGTLFSVSFLVTGTGATSIDIVQYQNGAPRSLIIDSNNARLDYQPADAYFRNKPGIPPVATFSFSPQLRLFNTTVALDASQSYDPDNATLPGISKYIWDFGDGSALVSNPGPFASHIFAFGLIPVAGTFSVKLVVIDVDNGLPMRLIIPVKVTLILHDIAVSLSLNKVLLTVGDTLQLQVALANRGTLDEHANLNVTYDSQGSTAIARETGLVLPVGSVRIFNYTLSTSSLVTRAYTVTAQALIVNATTEAIIPDPTPDDNIALGSFVVVAPPPAGGHASLVRWRSFPEFRHEILSRNPIQTLLAAVANNGNQTIDVYVRFDVTVDTGGEFSLLTRQVTLVPGQEIDSRSNSSFTAHFSPFPGVYTVTATVYYNAVAGSFNYTPDLSSQKSYSFIAS
jgi:hypothetical protein